MDQIWVGVDIGGTKTAVVVSAKPPAVLWRREFPTRPEDGPEHAIASIQSFIRDALSAHPGAVVEGIGVSCGGPLDRRTGVVQAPPNLQTWVDVPICSILESEFATRCRLENDANAGAVAEHRFGAGQGVDHMVFLTMGTGLGAGIIADGRLYHGASDLAGEIGHVRLTSDGPVGYNKAGSVEGWASGGGIAHLASSMTAEARMNGPASTLLDIREPLTARDVGLAAQAGDHLALEIIRKAGRKLGRTLAILVDILNPQRIVIGGLAVRLGDLLLGPAREILAQEALAPSLKVCEIVPAALNETIGDVAALSVALGYCGEEK